MRPARSRIGFPRPARPTASGRLMVAVGWLLVAAVGLAALLGSAGLRLGS